MSNTHHLVGTGPNKVIVLHGWFGDRNAFAPMERHLDANAYTYVFMDCRGYGGMKEAKGQYTMDEVAADTLALADSLGFSDFSLVGHSMGGKAIQRVLARAPERVRSLVGITPVPASGIPLDENAWALFSGAADKPENRYAIIDHTTGRRRPREWIEELVRYSLEHSSRDAFAAYLPAWAKGDFSDEIRGLEHQVKVILGEHDLAIREDAMRATWLAWYPNAQLQLLSGCGHYPMNESPRALAEAVEGFLQH